MILKHHAIEIEMKDEKKIHCWRKADSEKEIEVIELWISSFIMFVCFAGPIFRQRACSYRLIKNSDSIFLQGHRFSINL